MANNDCMALLKLIDLCILCIENESKSANKFDDELLPITKNEYKIETILNNKGYKILHKLTKTSQGAVYKAVNTNTANTVIIKIAAKDLVDNGLGKLASGVTIKLPENLLDEVKILYEVTIQLYEQNIAAAFVKYIDFFNDSHNYFFIMSDGGESLTAFIEKCHKLIFDEKLEIAEWIIIIQLIFKQIIDFMEVLYHKLMIGHLDMSLCNILIKNVQIIEDENGTMKISKDFQIVLCDFGLANSFKLQNDFKCTKFVGARRYMSPEAFCKIKAFDACLNDIWSIGVCLFTMCVGYHPYNTPNSGDYQFQLIKNGKIRQLLIMMNKECFVTEEIFDLLKKIFMNEKDRISLTQIQNHPFLRV